MIKTGQDFWKSVEQVDRLHEKIAFWLSWKMTLFMPIGLIMCGVHLRKIGKQLRLQSAFLDQTEATPWGKARAALAAKEEG